VNKQFVELIFIAGSGAVAVVRVFVEDFYKEQQDLSLGKPILIKHTYRRADHWSG
jgi:hypothetical protein